MHKLVCVLLACCLCLSAQIVGRHRKIFPSGGITAPTLIGAFSTPQFGSALLTQNTSTFTTAIGDVLVAYAVEEGAGTDTINTPPTGTYTGTWTLRQSYSNTSYTRVSLWTSVASSAQTSVYATISISISNFFGGTVLQFRNSSGVGITNSAQSSSGTPSVTLSGVSQNSAIVMVNGDWSAVTGARTYVTATAGSFTEETYYADGTRYGIEGGYYPSVGSAGTKTIGISAPAGMTWSLCAVEVKGQ